MSESVTIRTLAVSVVGSLIVGTIMGIGGMAFAFSGDVARLEENMKSLEDKLENTDSKIEKVERKLDETTRQIVEAGNDLAGVVATLKAMDGG